MEKSQIEEQIKELFDQWVAATGQEKLKKVRYAGPKFGKEEYRAILSALFSDWWSGGAYTVRAEKKLATFSDRNYGLLSNSGSSANLMLMSAAKDLYFQDGDKILTLSCGFPTTVNPIMANRLVPVFVDISLDDLNLDPGVLRNALEADPEIKGVFVAHTLGFKSRIDEILDVAREHDVQVFFDNCDAYGTVYKGRPIQSYGKAATFSFYVAHHISMGEGGGIVTNDADLHAAMRGFRNWGRYCASPNCCIRSLHPESFCPVQKLTKDCSLPSDYIVNYQYEFLGYNLKPLELQAAMLIEQLDKLRGFDDTRRANYQVLYDSVSKHKEFTIWGIDSDVSPFAFPMLLSKSAKFNRKHFVDFMARNGIETRMLFGGNLMRHPAYEKSKQHWESFGTHDNADNIAENFVMLGVSPVNSEEDIGLVCTKIDEFVGQWNV